MEYIPCVVQALAGDNDTVYACYSDGSIRHAGTKLLIERGGVFTQLKDLDVFCDCLAVLNDAVAWDISDELDETSCIDLDLWKMYEEGLAVADPWSLLSEAPQGHIWKTPSNPESIPDLRRSY